jgi:hypothetical protein
MVFVRRSRCAGRLISRNRVVLRRSGLVVLEKYEGQNETHRVDEISCLATAFTPFSLQNRQTPLRIYRHRVDTKPMADFLASPGFVTCTVAAAQVTGAIVYSPSLEMVKEKLALSSGGFGAWGS